MPDQEEDGAAGPLAWLRALAGGTGIVGCIGPFDACAFDSESDSDGETAERCHESEVVRRPDERSTTAMRDSLIGQSVRAKRRNTELITAPVESARASAVGCELCFTK